MNTRPVLVVDDDPAILSVVAEILRDEGYTVVTATNGAEALVVVGGTEPSVVLLDMRMPVLDGWGFVAALREQGRVLPILVMTAAQDARRWATDVDAAGFVAKPFDLMELLTAVERVRVDGNDHPACA